MSGSVGLGMWEWIGRELAFAEMSGTGGICILGSAGVLTLELGTGHGSIRMVFPRPSIVSIGGYEVDEDGYGSCSGSQGERMLLVFFICIRSSRWSSHE